MITWSCNSKNEKIKRFTFKVQKIPKTGILIYGIFRVQYSMNFWWYVIPAVFFNFFMGIHGSLFNGVCWFGGANINFIKFKRGLEWELPIFLIFVCYISRTICDMRSTQRFSKNYWLLSMTTLLIVWVGPEEKRWHFLVKTKPRTSNIDFPFFICIVH